MPTEDANAHVFSEDSEPFEWLTDEARMFLNRGYLVGDTTGEERVQEIAEYAEAILKRMAENSHEAQFDGFADKFVRYMSRGYYSLASPVWSNFGLDRGLPISCFGSYIGDSMEEILHTHAEVGMMTKVGGGTSGYFGDVRSRGSAITNNGTSNGTYPFAKMFDQEMDIISQGSTRRGFFAGYIDIEHEDFDEWAEIQSENDDIQSMMWGVVVGDEFMEDVRADCGDARKRWAKVLDSRVKRAIPYIIWRDNANRNKPQVYKEKGYDIKSSNLCSEIMLPLRSDESFVCCLSSYNLATYEEWRDNPDVVHTLIWFLDAVMQDFIDGAEYIPFMGRAVRFARRHRAVGAGALGWHSYLQSQGIAIESLQAMGKNEQIFSYLGKETKAASKELGRILGPASVADEQRNTTTMAVAPTKSSSFILGQVSPSIEPLKSNYYVRDTAKLKETYRNPYLQQELRKRGLDTRETWDSIMMKDGSVQHLDLPQDVKDTFKTFSELSQAVIVKQAAQRQKHIDQGQSLNLTIDPENVSTKDINKLYFDAWEQGVCALYYQHSVNGAQKHARNILDCSACEG